MPYHNFEDAAHVAKYIADINFSITGTAPVDSSPDKVKYYCSFTKHDITFDTTYQPPSAVDGEPTAADVLSLLADDALAIIDNNYSIDDFADEYGYTKPSQAIRAYEGHTKTLDWMKDTLEFDEDDVRQFTTVLHEDLAGVKAGVATIVSERQAEHERTHPKVPEGFVTIESLQEDLDLGDYGDRCTEFWNRYVNERFDDVADDLVDLSYHDLLKWLPDNYEWVEQAAENGRFYGSETDFFRMIQTAQRECFTQDMYVHQEDIVKSSPSNPSRTRASTPSRRSLPTRWTPTLTMRMPTGSMPHSMRRRSRLRASWPPILRALSATKTLLRRRLRSLSATTTTAS